MPITLEKVAADRAEITVQFGEETARVWYRPSVLTPEFQAGMNVTTGDTHVLARQLAALLDAWEVTAGGKPYPITPEALGQLPVDLLLAIFSAIMEDYEPGKKGSLVRTPSTKKPSS